MPEMHFHVRWPDATTTSCYSPSLVIKDYFIPGTAYPLEEFLQRSRTALAIASDRVREKYGFGCGQAIRQMEEIEQLAQRFRAMTDAQVVVESFQE